MIKAILLTFNQALLTLLLYFIGALIIGLALVPSVILILKVWKISNTMALTLKILIMCLTVAGSYFIFGLSLMVLVGFVRSFFFIRLKEGDYKMGSLEMLKWYFVNALFLIVRNVFMDFMLLTPFCSLFYRLMGTKLGLNVQINSKNVADHSLLEIGDRSVIGGNATVIAHLFESKGLRLAKVKIGKNVIIGLNSVIMPGVIIGDGSVVAAGAIVPKQTVIEPRTIYYSSTHQVKREQQ